MKKAVIYSALIVGFLLSIRMAVATNVMWLPCLVGSASNCLENQTTSMTAVSVGGYYAAADHGGGEYAYMSGVTCANITGTAGDFIADSPTITNVGSVTNLQVGSLITWTGAGSPVPAQKWRA